MEPCQDAGVFDLPHGVVKMRVLASRTCRALSSERWTSPVPKNSTSASTIALL